MAELALENTPDLGDYLAALKSRIGMIFLVSAITFTIGLVIAYTLPPVYESKSTILIEQQEIPVDLVRTTVTSYAGKRIQVISQTVMTRKNLMETINKFDLYPDKRKTQTTEELIEQMREDIKIDMITADVVDPRSGAPKKATIAFTVGFSGKNPDKVQKVTTELTSLYLNENLKTRAEKTEETSQFLAAEAKRLEAQIEHMDKDIAAFSEEYMGNLPESKTITNSLLQSVKLDIDSIDDQIRTSNETSQYLQGQLALLDPYESSADTEDLGPAARLHVLQNNLTSLLTRYSKDHPDVIATRRSIAALEQELGIPQDSDENESDQLEALRSQLAIAEKSYSDEHPDVKSLKRQIAALEKSNPSGSTTTGKVTAPDKLAPTNDAYITLKSQIDRIRISTKLARERQQKLRDKQAIYEQRLLELPAIEGKYRAMKRDYGNATARYQELKAKQMSADVAMEMEKKRKGEKFTLIDPAVVPSKPVSPNRPAIVIISLILALGGGIGSAFAAETMSAVVRGPKGLVAILNTAPLAIVPYLENNADITRKKTRFRILVAAVIISIVLILILINFFYSPLDVLYFRGIRKVDTLVGG